MYIAQLQDPTFAGRDLTSLRTGIMSGSPCPIEIMKRVIDEMHCPQMCIVYGQTETSPAITHTRPHDAAADKSETIGQPIAQIEVKIIDPASGGIVPVDTPGELCTRGFLVMMGHYDMPEATA